MIDLDESIIAVAISPLPNLLLNACPGAELVHNVGFTALGGDCRQSEAKLRLAADRTRLAVTLRSPGADANQLRLVRVRKKAEPSAAFKDQASGGLILLALCRTDPAQPKSDGFTRDFIASDPFGYLDREVLLNAGISLSGACQETIGGIALNRAAAGGNPQVAGADLSPSRSVPSSVASSEHRQGDERRFPIALDEDRYLRQRMLHEISAALHSKRPAVASVHIGLATLYAARIGTQANAG